MISLKSPIIVSTNTKSFVPRRIRQIQRACTTDTIDPIFFDMYISKICSNVDKTKQAVCLANLDIPPIEKQIESIAFMNKLTEVLDVETFTTITDKIIHLYIHDQQLLLENLIANLLFYQQSLEQIRVILNQV